MALDIRVTVQDGASSVALHEVESGWSAFGIGATILVCASRLS